MTSHELPELSLCTAMYVLKKGVLQRIDEGLKEQELIEIFRKE